MTDRFETTGTTELQVRFHLAHQPDVLDILVVPAVLNDQLGVAVSVERANLAKVGTKLDGARLKRLVELHIVEFQFPNPNQHSSTNLRP
jgi:hypothetical protein